jgi:hypothetical protein
MRDDDWLGEQEAIIHLKNEMEGPRSDNDVLLARRELFYLVQDGEVPWRASERNGQKLEAPRLFGPEEWWSGSYERSEFHRANLADWGVPAQCGEWGGLEFGWRELRARCRPPGAALLAADAPPPAPKGRGGRKEEFPWDDIVGELICMVHEGEIKKSDAGTARCLEDRLIRKRHKRLPSPQYLEGKVRSWLVAYRATLTR